MTGVFEIVAIDPETGARAGRLFTAHGVVETPAFMPVGTQGCVKAVSPQELLECGIQIFLANTYHLFLRPGLEVLRRAGGLHRFAGWSGPILTDSGGFQIYSLSEFRKITEEGVYFRSHLDGSYILFTPESAVDHQRAIGSDIMMVLDECTPYPCDRSYAVRSLELTHAWAERSLHRFQETQPEYGHSQLLFGIVQGSVYLDLRRQSAERLSQLDFPGYALGGLSVGEPKEVMYEVIDQTAPLLPHDRPRYLMGVGKPEDLVEAVGMGIDLFDCVIPTRNGRNGTVFTWEGPLVIKNGRFKDDFRPIDESCSCYTCRNYTRAFVRHLFNAGEVLALRLATIHNLTFYATLMSQAREAILAGRFRQWARDFYSRYRTSAEEKIPEQETV
ncbi:MAG: tRNA guanosine(34) transglycosylase Tgt [candidate division KSB1 bacterium]|nr:tRNA guanosine(34) transglycosylase Tgt [candidate division KSB1 bacterium]